RGPAIAANAEHSDDTAICVHESKRRPAVGAQAKRGNDTFVRVRETDRGPIVGSHAYRGDDTALRVLESKIRPAIRIAAHRGNHEAIRIADQKGPCRDGPRPVKNALGQSQGDRSKGTGPKNQPARSTALAFNAIEPLRHSIDSKLRFDSHCWSPHVPQD